MASNFSFLRTQFPGLEKTGEFAERYLYSDSNSCLLSWACCAKISLIKCLTLTI